MATRKKFLLSNLSAGRALYRASPPARYRALALEVELELERAQARERLAAHADCLYRPEDACAALCWNCDRPTPAHRGGVTDYKERRGKLRTGRDGLHWPREMAEGRDPGGEMSASATSDSARSTAT